MKFLTNKLPYFLANFQFKFNKLKYGFTLIALILHNQREMCGIFKPSLRYKAPWLLLYFRSSKLILDEYIETQPNRKHTLFARL